MTSMPPWRHGVMAFRSPLVEDGDEDEDEAEDEDED